MSVDRFPRGIWGIPPGLSDLTFVDPVSMSSETDQTIEALEDVITTVQREIARLKAVDDLVTSPTAQSRAGASTVTLPPPPPPPPSPAPPLPSSPPSPVPTPRVAAAAGPVAAHQKLTAEVAFRVGGISLVVLSAIFFVSTAISRGWIGPTAQLGLATIVSLGFVAQSFRFDSGKSAWRTTFAGGGAAGFFVAGVVGHLGLDVLSMTAAMVWLGGAIAGFFGLSRLHRAEVLAAMAAPAYFIGTGLMVASGVDSPAVLGFGAALFAAALAATTGGQGWPVARSIGAATAGLVAALAAATSEVESITSLPVVSQLVAIVALGFVAWQQGIEFKASEDGTYSVVAAIEARAAALFVPWVGLSLGWLFNGSSVVSGDGSPSIGWVIVGAGLIGGVLVSIVGDRFSPLMVVLHKLGAVGTMVIGLATVLDGPALLVALLSAAIGSFVLARSTSVAEALGFAIIAGALVVTWTAGIILDGLANDGLSLGESLATATVFGAAFAGLWFARHHESVPAIASATWGGVLVWIAALWRLVPQEQMWISMSWAAISLLLLASRSLWPSYLRRQHFSRVIKLALGTLALTGIKLIFVDLVAVDILWRAGLFFVIGGTFLRLAFVLPGILDHDHDREDEVAPTVVSDAS